MDVDRISIFGNAIDEEETSNRMIRVLLLLLLPLLFCRATSGCHAACTTAALLFLNSSLCVKASIGLNYFPWVVVFSHAAELPCVKRA